MLKHIQTALTLIVLLCSVAAFTALGQSSGTNSSAKMSDQEMMQKMDHMSTTEKAGMFDKMSHEQKMEAMKMAGHDMSKMSNQEQMQMMSNLTPEQKAKMFDKMPTDTKMATMKMGSKEQPAK